MLAVEFKIFETIENFITQSFNSGYRIGGMVLGLFGFIISVMMLIAAIKLWQKGDHKKAGIELLKVIIIGVVVFFGVRGLWGMGKTVSDENLKQFDLGGKPKATDFIN